MVLAWQVILCQLLLIIGFGQIFWEITLLWLGLTTWLCFFPFQRHSLVVGTGKNLGLKDVAKILVPFHHYRFPLAQRLGDPELKKRFWWFIGVLMIPLLFGN